MLDYSAGCSLFDKYMDTIDQEHSGNLHCDLPYIFSMDTVVNKSGTNLIEICLCSDLKLVNGRIGDDAGIGNYTFMSPNGCSVIDYAVRSYDLFPFISDFIVNDLYSCSLHTHVQLNLVFSCANKLSQDECHTDSYTKITWDSSKRNGYIESVENNSQFLRNTEDEIVSANIDLNDGIDLIYNISSNTFGETKQLKQYKYRRKFKSKLFNQACEIVSRECIAANKMYRKCKNISNRDAMISKRRSYRLANRKAKYEYNNEQKKRLHNLVTNSLQYQSRSVL